MIGNSHLILDMLFLKTTVHKNIMKYLVWKYYAETCNLENHSWKFEVLAWKQVNLKIHT